jgi:hypothetical protein|tara:strand:- start:497 stop:664 length:168 start_codon:yes stop_codon:yes gene_type:complete
VKHTPIVIDFTFCGAETIIKGTKFLTKNMAEVADATKSAIHIAASDGNRQKICNK